MSNTQQSEKVEPGRLNEVCRTLIVAIVFAHSSLLGQAPITEKTEDIASAFVVSGGGITMPIGAFLLVRKGGEVGAIRLTKIHTDASQLVGTSSYESYFQVNNSGPFTSGKLPIKIGELTLKPLGRLRFQTSQNKAHIGPWSFGFIAPNLIAMWPFRGDSRDYGYEFAPTSARELSEIDVHDKRLRWFRFNRDAVLNLPVNDLPK